MIRCIVELFGLSRRITELRKVEVELNDRASLRDIVAALRRKIPTLEGSVIRPGENRLTKHYVFNINGSFYFDDMEHQFQSDDHVILLTFPFGG
jgi:hypothetical protein